MMGPKALYSVFQGFALLTAIVLKPRSPFPWMQRLGLLSGAIFGAGVGAKLPFALLSHEPFLSAPTWLSDGKTILAGMAGGYLGVEIAKALMRIRAKTGDDLAVPLAAGVAVGRWGCFFNGCCGAPLVPPLESAFHASMAILLWKLKGVEALRWQLLKLYYIAYCAFRFGVEFIRTEPRILGGLTGYQLGAAALAAGMAILWARDERLKKAAPVPVAPGSPAA